MLWLGLGTKKNKHLPRVNKTQFGLKYLFVTIVDGDTLTSCEKKQALSPQKQLEISSGVLKNDPVA